MVGSVGGDDRAAPGAGHALRWPAGLSPGCADVWAVSELAIGAAPAAVFSCLVTVGRWERDFAAIRNVRVAAPGRGRLGPDSVFEFEIDGLRLCAHVVGFRAGHRLAWSGQGIDISAYHEWAVSGGPGGSRVLAGFAGRGAAAVALREPDPHAARRTLDRWAAGLKAATERGRR